MATTYNLTINKGDSYQLRANLTIQTPDFCVGSACSVVPMDLTDKTVVAVIKRSFDGCEPSAVFDMDIENPDSGIVDLLLTASESNKLDPTKTYYWDLRVLDTAENKAFTAFKGTVTVTPTVSE